jgi:hypothetical protein
VGGLTEAWRIAWMADAHNIQWVPHGDHGYRSGGSVGGRKIVDKSRSSGD